MQTICTEIPQISHKIKLVSFKMCVQLKKKETPGKHSLHVKIAASVLLKLFITGNKISYTTDAPYRMSGTLFSCARCQQCTIDLVIWFVQVTLYVMVLRCLCFVSSQTSFQAVRITGCRCFNLVENN